MVSVPRWIANNWFKRLFKTVEDVRVGKHILLQIEAPSEEQARKIADEASKKLLANPVMEFYEIEVALIP